MLSSASGPPGSARKPYKPWFKHKNRQTRDTTIVFGHWARLGLYTKKNVICLDTGCVWGGALTMLRLDQADPTPISLPCPRRQNPAGFA